MKNYYFILGLNIYASEGEIKRAYRKLALQYHPDKNPSPEAESIFKEINEAYEVLGDSASKANYDLLLKGGVPETNTVNPRPHRDPRYRPRPRGSYSTKTKKQELLEIMAQYLQYAILMSRVSLAFCVILLIDYNLPYQVSEQKVIEVSGSAQIRGARTYQLQLENGGAVNMSSRAAQEFRPGASLLMHKTSLFNVPVQLENTATHFITNVPISVYGNFLFAPLIMLITSLLGAFYWKGIEFRFNLGVVNFFLLLLTLLFLRVHLIAL